MSKLRFGFLYDFRNPAQWRRPWEALYAETLDVIAATERLGFGAAYVPEHHLADDGYLPTPLTLLAAIPGKQMEVTLIKSVEVERATGAFTDCGSPSEVEAVLADRLAPLGVPMVSAADVGHTPTTLPMPLGVAATLDADRGRLTLARPALA